MSDKGHNKPWSKKGEKGTGRGERKQVVVKAADLEISAPTPGTTFPVGGGAEAAGLMALLQKASSGRSSGVKEPALASDAESDSPSGGAILRGCENELKPCQLQFSSLTRS